MQNFVSYKELCGIVPEETKIFLNDFFTYNDFDIYDLSSKNKLSKIRFSYQLLAYAYAFCENPKVQMVLDDWQFTESELEIEVDDDETNDKDIIEELYNRFYNFIYDPSQNISSLNSLTILDIIYININFLTQIISSSTLKELSPKPDEEIIECFQKMLINGYLRKHEYISTLKDQEREEYLENQVIKLREKMDYKTMLFIETSAAIFSKIYNNKSHVDDCIALSIFAAIYYCPYTQDEANYLESLDLKRDTFNEILQSFEFINGKLGKTLPDLDRNNINFYFKKVFDLKKENANFSIEYLISKLFDESFSRSVILKNIMDARHIDFKIFKKLHENVLKYLEEEKQNSSNIELNVLYDKASKSLIKYYKKVAKVYLYLNKLNESSQFDVKFTDSEVLGLAFVINMLKASSEFRNYFNENGINLEKCFEYLNINKDEFDIEMSKEDDTSYDDVLIKIYNRFVKEHNSDAYESKMWNVIFSIKNNTRVKKMIIELLDSKSNYEDVIIEYKNTFEKFSKAKMNKKRFEEMTKLYKDLNIKVVQYLECASCNFTLIKDSFPKSYSDKDIAEIVLLTIISVTNEPIKDELTDYFFEKHFKKFSYERLRKLKSIFDEDVNIEIIEKYLIKYVLGGHNKDKKREDIEVIDIINNLFNQELNKSIAIKEFLENFSLFKYDDFNGDLVSKCKEYEKEKNEAAELKAKKELESRAEKNSNFEEKEFLYKTTKFFEKKLKDEYQDPEIPASYVAKLLLFYRNNNPYIRFLKKIGIDEDKLYEYFKITKEEFDESINSQVNYVKWSKEYNKYDFGNNLDNQFVKMFSNEYIDIIRKFVLTYISKERFEILLKELETNEDYEAPLTKEEQLEVFSNMEIPTLELTSLTTIQEYGDELSEQSDIIFKALTTYVDSKKEDAIVVGELSRDIKIISKPDEEPKKFTLFKKKTPSTPPVDKKEVLDRLDNFLSNKEVELKDGLKEFEFIKKFIGVYLMNAQSYLEKLKAAKEKFTLEVQNKDYVENDFRIADDKLKMQLLDSRIASINTAVIKMLQQYQRIVIQMSTHVSLISQIHDSRETILQNLYIEMTLNEGIAKEREGIDSLNCLADLLSSMQTDNATNMMSNIEAINAINRDNNKVLTENDELLITQIIEDQKLIPQKNNESNDDKVRTKK